MATVPQKRKRWSLRVVRADGSVGPRLIAVTPAQRALFSLALAVAGVSYIVEELAA